MPLALKPRSYGRALVLEAPSRPMLHLVPPLFFLPVPLGLPTRPSAAATGLVLGSLLPRCVPVITSRHLHLSESALPILCSHPFCGKGTRCTLTKPSGTIPVSHSRPPLWPPLYSLSVSMPSDSCPSIRMEIHSNIQPQIPPCIRPAGATGRFSYWRRTPPPPS